MSESFYKPAGLHSGQKVFLATVVYENPSPAYTFSIYDAQRALAEGGIASAYYLLAGNCHVDDARNLVLSKFIASDCTDLVFLDADVSWRPEDLVRLCQFDCDMVGGVYPHRRTHTGQMPVRMLEGVVEAEDGLLEVEGLPAGFLRIRRCETLERLVERAKKYGNDDDQVAILFERTYQPGTRIGGDISFCLKWREAGGKLYAAPDMVLGHTAKAVLQDSLAAALRRQAGTTLQYAAERIRAGDYDDTLLSEALQAWGNQPWAGDIELVRAAVDAAAAADGPILETGSGITTLLMAAAAPDQVVFCLEHDRGWAKVLEHKAYQAGVTNIAIVHCGIKNGWYVVEDGLPEVFALGLNDGPPRHLGNRVKFFDQGWASKCDVLIVDDAADPIYRATMRAWAAAWGRSFDLAADHVALIGEQRTEEKAA